MDITTYSRTMKKTILLFSSILIALSTQAQLKTEFEIPKPEDDSTSVMLKTLSDDDILAVASLLFWCRDVWLRQFPLSPSSIGYRGTGGGGR